MSPSWGMGVAALGMVSGFIWQIEWGNSKDLTCFRKIN